MKDADYFNTLVNEWVENEVVANRKASQSHGELWPLWSHLGKLGD